MVQPRSKRRARAPCSLFTIAVLAFISLALIVAWVWATNYGGSGDGSGAFDYQRWRHGGDADGSAHGGLRPADAPAFPSIDQVHAADQQAAAAARIAALERENQRLRATAAAGQPATNVPAAGAPAVATAGAPPPPPAGILCNADNDAARGRAPGGLVGLLHRTQNPPDCAKAQFLVFTLPKPRTKDTRNLGAMSTTLNRWLLVAHHYKRVLIFDDTPWKLAECASASWECYFRPLSRCRAKDVLASTPKDQVAFHGSNKAPLPNARVVRVKQTWWKVIDWEKTARDTLGSGLLTGDLFRAGLEYLLRMNDAMRADVERGLRLSLYDDGDAGAHGGGGYKFDPSRAVGLPIRASDKCHGHQLTKGLLNSAKGARVGFEGIHAHGEMDCFAFDDFIARARAVRAHVDPAVDTIILTSEDPGVIAASKTAALRAEGWRFVYNTIDVLQGTGSATSVATAAMGHAHTVRDVFVSMLVSLHLQMRARYLFLTYESNWNTIIFRLSRGSCGLHRDSVQMDMRGNILKHAS